MTQVVVGDPGDLAEQLRGRRAAAHDDDVLAGELVGATR